MEQGAGFMADVTSQGCKVNSSENENDIRNPDLYKGFETGQESLWFIGQSPLKIETRPGQAMEASGSGQRWF